MGLYLFDLFAFSLPFWLVLTVIFIIYGKKRNYYNLISKILVSVLILATVSFMIFVIGLFGGAV